MTPEPRAGGPLPPRRRRRATLAVPPPQAWRSEINVTPLVDVVLVLLIIFMVITPLLHRGVPIDLPATHHHTRRNDTGAQLVVGVRSDGVFIDADAVDNASLRSRLASELAVPTRPVHVRGDKNLPYGRVRAVMDLLHEVGAGTINLASEEAP